MSRYTIAMVLGLIATASPVTAADPPKKIQFGITTPAMREALSRMKKSMPKTVVFK